MMEKEYTYSFIIPHKNCPDLLRRCVDSIPVRDDVQIIVVDDNSDDGKKPALKDRKGLQVILLDAEHSKGAGRARNVGLDHAEGKWLLFADADDFFSENLSSLLDKYKNVQKTDIVYLNACTFDENGLINAYKTDQLIKNYLAGKNSAEMDLRYSLWTPWSRMVRQSVVNDFNIRFDEIPAGNDLMFGLKCSKYAKKMLVEPKFVYNYYTPSIGSCTDNARKKMIDSRLTLRGKLILFYREVGYMANTNLLDVIFSFYIRNGGSLRDCITKYSKFRKEYNVSLFDDFCKFVKNRIKH